MVDETKHMVLVPEAKLSDEGFYRCRITFNGKVELSNWTYVSVGKKVFMEFETVKKDY